MQTTPSLSLLHDVLYGWPQHFINFTENLLFLTAFQMKDMSHDNLAMFLGACVDAANICYIMQYFNKGSLLVGITHETLWMTSMLCLKDSSFEMKKPDKVWQCLINHINNDLDQHCPIRKFQILIYKPDWVNNTLLEQIRDRDYFYKKAKTTKNEDDWNIAKHLRNVTNSNIRKAKANYTIQKLNQLKGDSTKFWKEIKKVFPTSNKKSQAKLLLKQDDKSILESDAADYINDFFVNVGNLTTKGKNIPKTTTRRRAKTTTRRRVRQSKQRNGPPNLTQRIASWTPKNFTETEVYKVVNNMDINKSPGLPNINSLVVKEAFKTLISPVTFMFNLSLESCSFPTSWKQATVIPIPKAGDPSQVTNLRPISLLPQPGKIGTQSTDKLSWDQKTTLPTPTWFSQKQINCRGHLSSVRENQL